MSRKRFSTFSGVLWESVMGIALMTRPRRQDVLTEDALAENDAQKESVMSVPPMPPSDIVPFAVTGFVDDAPGGSGLGSGWPSLS